MKERWKPVVGHPGYYVSSRGRVRSEKRMLRPAPNGYARVVLAGDVTRYVHHLVAEAFIGPRPAGFHVDHVDRNRRNNGWRNLRYLNQRDNNRHSAAKLTTAEVSCIKLRLLDHNTTLRALAATMRVSTECISGINSGRSWSDVDPQPPRGYPYMSRRVNTRRFDTSQAIKRALEGAGV